MKRFTPREALIGAAAVVLAALLIWFFAFSGRPFADIAINLITDIFFAIFVVLFIEYAIERDRFERNHSRRRATALTVHKFYQDASSLITTIIADGVASSPPTSTPTPEEVTARAQSLGSTSSIQDAFEEQPIPYAAYFFTEFTGKADAGVIPRRSSAVYLQQLAQNLEKTYLEIFQLDNGTIPDDVVDAMTKLKRHGFVLLCRDVLGFKPVRMGYWPEEELHQYFFSLGAIKSYYSPILDYVDDGNNGEVALNAVRNSLTKKKQAAVI